MEWVGYENRDDERSWEPESNVAGAEESVREFHQKYPNKAKRANSASSTSTTKNGENHQKSPNNPETTTASLVLTPVQTLLEAVQSHLDEPLQQQ